MARVRIDVVGAETGFHQLGGGVAFPNRPLAGAEHAYAGRALFLQRFLPLLRHDIERFIPADGFELAVLVVNAVGFAQQWLGQAVFAVHDLGKEVPLDAIEPPVHRSVRVALGRDHAAVLGANQHGAARSAEAARSLVPPNSGCLELGLGRAVADRDPGSRSRCGGRSRLQECPAGFRDCHGSGLRLGWMWLAETRLRMPRDLRSGDR